jgi:hypothetical protein
MENDKLYRLMDLLDEIKQLDSIISKHEAESKNDSLIMVNQYTARKEQLLSYFINEINASSENKSFRLTLIKQIMDVFYPTKNKKNKKIDDKNLIELAQALAI